MHQELLLLIGISFSMGFTPGPNNAVASYSAFNFGVRKTLPIILGVGFGYTVLVILLIFALISVFQKFKFKAFPASHWPLGIANIAPLQTSDRYADENNVKHIVTANHGSTYKPNSFGTPNPVKNKSIRNSVIK